MKTGWQYRKKRIYANFRRQTMINKKKELLNIQYAQKTKTKIMKYREDDNRVLPFYEKRL